MKLYTFPPAPNPARVNFFINEKRLAGADLDLELFDKDGTSVASSTGTDENEILNEETIFGRKKVLGDYSKNAICSYWIEMIKSNVLLYNLFPSSILSVKSIPQNNSQEEPPEVTACFANIESISMNPYLDTRERFAI